MSNRSFFCVSYSTLACTNRSGVLSHKQPCRGYPVGAPKFYLGTFKNAASSRCTSGVAMNYICRNFSLFIDRSSTRGRSCNTLRPGGGGLPLPHAFNKNSNTFISSTTNNSLFLVSKRHSSDGRPFYESDEVAFVVAAVGIPWILYNVYRQIMINRYASDYNSKHYDPAKKSPEEKYAKDSKFKFRPRKLRPVQVKIRDRLLPDDYTYISKVDGKEKPMDWIGIIKRKKKRVIERKKKKVESYSWPFCTPRKVREYDRLITIGEEWRRMGYEIDLSPVTDIPRRERTKFEKAVDRLVFNYFK